MKIYFHLCWVLVIAALFPARAFVFYPVNDDPNLPLRWNINSAAALPNIVNPATRAVRYYIASDAFSVTNRDAEMAAVKACFDQWQSISGSHLRFEFAGLIDPAGVDVSQDGTNVVFWATKSLRVNRNQMNIASLRAWTSVNFSADGSITEADIVLNGIEYQWFTDFNNRLNQAQFIESVLLHEIGHLVGLDHAVAGGATVIPGANGVSSEAGLSADEIAAMRFLYSVSNWPSAGISGKVRLNGNPVFGAVVVAEDTQGNVASATVTRSDGSYLMRGLAPGNYLVRALPLDPPTAGNDKLIQGRDIAPEYSSALTAFSPTPNQSVTLANGVLLTADLNVSAGPAFRITSISKPTTIPTLVSVVRNAITLTQGQSDLYVGVSGPNLPAGSVLTVTGDGLTVGETTFLQGQLAPGINSLVTKVTVSATATPGLRSFVVTHGSDVAYATGFLEVAAAVPDYNFDGLDDRFQRAFWSPWTIPSAAPSSDPDADGFSNDFEFRTGTDPTSSTSYRLQIKSATRIAGTTAISWASDPGKRYQLYGRTSLSAGDWQALGRSLSATGNEMTQFDNSVAELRFYRLELIR